MVYVFEVLQDMLAWQLSNNSDWLMTLTFIVHLMHIADAHLCV